MRKDDRDKILNTTITMRVPRKVKEEFVTLCESRNEHYQAVIRRFMELAIKTPQKLEEQKRRKQYLDGQRLL